MTNVVLVFVHGTPSRKQHFQEVVQPPNIALPCGHVVCPEDFKLMGGKVQQRQEVDDDESVEDDYALLEAQYQAMRTQRIRDSSLRLTMGISSSSARPHSDSDEEDVVVDDDDDDDDSDEEEEDAADDDDDDSHQFMPRMVLDPRVDVGSFRDVDDATTSSHVSEPPSLIARRQRLAQRMYDAETGIIHGDGSIPQSIGSGRERRENANADGIVSPFAGSMRHRYSIEPRSGAMHDVVYFMRRVESWQVWQLTANGMQPLVQVENTQHGVSLLKSTTAFAVVTKVPHPRVVNYGMVGEALCGYDIDSDAQVVVDGSAFWTLGPVAGASNTSMLKYYSIQFPRGKPVRRVSSESTLYRGCMNSCWVHVRQRTAHIDSGLWFFKTNGQKHILNSSAISPHALIAPNVDKSVWMMQRSNSQTVLRRVGFVERNLSSDALACDCTRQSSLITNAHGGVYIHTRKDGQWSLLVYKDDILRTLTTGHPDAKLTVDRHGNAWILKKSQTSRHLRLFKVDAQNDAVLDVPGSFDDVSFLTGAY